MYLLLFNKKEKISPFFCSSLFGCLLYAGELWLAIVIVTVNWWQSALSCSVGLPLVGGLGQPLWEGRGTGQNKVGYIIRIKSILLHTKVKETANVRLFCCWSTLPGLSLPASVDSPWALFCLVLHVTPGSLTGLMLFPGPDVIIYNRVLRLFLFSTFWSSFTFCSLAWLSKAKVTCPCLISHLGLLYYYKVIIRTTAQLTQGPQ